jgi:hypothetical protein
LKKLTLFLVVALLVLVATSLFATPISTAGEAIDTSEQTLQVNMLAADFDTIGHAAPAFTRAREPWRSPAGDHQYLLNDGLSPATIHAATAPSLSNRDRMPVNAKTDRKAPRARARDVQRSISF